MAISDPNAAMAPGVQYDQFGRPIVVVPNPNQPPALGVGTGLPNNQPILMNPTQPTTNSGVLSNPMSNNNRSFTQLAVQRPDLSIGTNEMLMRVGGAGLEGAQKSGLQSYANMLNTYGGIQDQRRSNAMTEYNADYRACLLYTSDAADE